MYINEPYPVYYVSRGNVTGLTTIYLVIKKPDGTLEGAYSLTEPDPVTLPGRYMYTYTPLTEGEYLFSIFENGSWQSSKSEYFYTRPKYSPVAGFD